MMRSPLTVSSGGILFECSIRQTNGRYGPHQADTAFPNPENRLGALITFTELYLHLVWATWDRLPWLTPDIITRVHAAIAQRCRHLHCEPLAVGGVANHVHVLVRLHPSVDVARLAKAVKGSTSHLVTHVLLPRQPFKWQGAYGAFTLGKKDVPALIRYIEEQPSHHADGTLWDEAERCSSD